MLYARQDDGSPRADDQCHGSLPSAPRSAARLAGSDGLAERSLEMEATARAMLSVCEGLVLALTENGVLDRREMKYTLEDARDAHRSSSDTDRKAVHQRAAAIISRLIDSVEAA